MRGKCCVSGFGGQDILDTVQSQTDVDIVSKGAPRECGSARFSFNAFNGSPLVGGGVSLAEQIAAAAGAGFLLMALDRFSLENFLAAGSRIEDVRHMLDSAGIGCGAITAAGMLGLDPQAIAAIGRASDWARVLGAPFVQINVGNAGAAQRDAMEAACDAAGQGVRLAVEYMPFTPLNRVGDAVALARHVGFNRAGVLIDVWHHERGPDSWDDLAAVPLEAIAYVEFDDALPAGADMAEDTMQSRTFPGEGVFDLRRFADIIAKIGYSGVVSIEILNAQWRSGDMKEFAERAFNSSKAYW